jgi:malonate-semialdehyde dehydrogenase (acetylating)/methylmalonate-semialdehyde dehydrogenase
MPIGIPHLLPCTNLHCCRGVLNVVHGTHNTVNNILDHPDIKAVSFVGSDNAGRYIYERGSLHGKRVQSNMGAKNHAVVLPDADVDSTVKALTGGAMVRGWG